MKSDHSGSGWYESAPVAIQGFTYVLMAADDHAGTTHPIATYRTFISAKEAANKRNSENNGIHYVVWEFALND